jgi:hypothetical protein
MQIKEGMLEQCSADNSNIISSPNFGTQRVKKENLERRQIDSDVCLPELIMYVNERDDDQLVEQS